MTSPALRRVAARSIVGGHMNKQMPTRSLWDWIKTIGGGILG